MRHFIATENHLSVFTVLYNRVISGLCCTWINGHLLKNLM